jgi:predicted Fe-S protein YdhL (DUF1289 family)
MRAGQRNIERVPPCAGPVPAQWFLNPGSPADMSTPFLAVLSPCIGVCCLDDAGLCEGCHRTSAEIARWSQMNDNERLRFIEDILPAREALRG